MVSDPAKQPVLFEEIAANNNKRLGIVTLNSEATLNALSREMVDLLAPQLQTWDEDGDLAAILIRAVGTKAFSAGGDIQSLYAWMNDYLRRGDVDALKEAEQFFQHEYRLDAAIYHYKKPILAWGHGIIMGGGFGVYSGCRFRIVTEASRIALPEVAIALFPDVGATYHLNRIEGNMGRFLALTGSSLNAADGLHAGVADYFAPHGEQQSLIDKLLQQPWSNSIEDNNGLIRQLLGDIQRSAINDLPVSPLQTFAKEITRLSAASSLADFAAQLNQLVNELPADESWLTRARDNFNYSSPLALTWTDRHLRDCRGLSYPDVLREDLVLVANIIRGNEFAEGIRARVIDKDQQPDWHWKTIAEVPPEVVATMFAPPWPENPLADL